MTPLIIEAAINGATSPALNPNVPHGTDQIVASALRCLEAGASIIHHHTDDSILTARHASEPYRDVWERVYRERPDALLYPTMGSGGAHTNIRERYAHIEELIAAELLHLTIIDPGSVSLGPNGPDGLPMPIDFVYQNTFADVRYMVDVANRGGVAAHVSIFEPGFLRVALAYHAAGQLPPAKIQLYFGGPDLAFGLPPTPASLEAYIDMVGGTGLPWMVGVLGGNVRDTLAEHAIERGGHVRVGLEDYAGPRQPRNEELIAEVVALASKAGRRIATPSEAAEIIGIRRATRTQ